MADFDNDPTGSSGHGTWVASVAMAEHNGKGLAGSCPKCLFIPIKAAKNTNPESISHGYDGLLYAAEHGAKVINLSWGSILTNDQFPKILKDLIYTVAVDMDVVIVAAGGNKGTELNYQPSSQEHVLGVTTMYQDTSMWVHGTYNTDIDIIAQGGYVHIAHNSNDSSYRIDAGSSLAAPLVSGAAGLVRSKFPNYTSEQVIQKLRVTGLSIDSRLNKKYEERVGFMLNPKKSLADTTTPALRIIETNYEDLIRGNGDTVTIKYRFKNFLYPVNIVNGAFNSKDSLSNVIDSVAIITRIEMLDTSDFYEQKVYIPAFSGDSIKTTIRTGFNADGYYDYQYKTFLFRKDKITSFNTINDNKTSQIYPNPVLQGGKLSFSNTLKFIKITSLDGRILYDWSGEHNEINIPLSIVPGLYIIKSDLFSNTLTVY